MEKGENFCHFTLWSTGTCKTFHDMWQQQQLQPQVVITGCDHIKFGVLRTRFRVPLDANSSRLLTIQVKNTELIKGVDK